MAEHTELHDVVVELRLLRADFEHIVEQNKQHSAMYTEVFDRLRKIEQSIAVLQATRPSKVSGWTIAAVVITALIAAITFVNEVSLATP